MSKTAIEIIDEHLNTKRYAIQIYQVNNKLAKATTSNRYNWTREDILKEASTLKDFLLALPNKGYSSGTTIALRKPNGNGYVTTGETTLNFSNEAKQTAQSTTPMNNNPSAPITKPEAAYSPQPPQMAMGYAALPQDEIISMRVKLERYDDLRDKCSRVEKERDKAETELRQEKTKLWDLERQLSLIQEKHEFQILVADKDRKGFFESDAGKEFLSQGMQALPQLAAAFSGGRQAQMPQVGMGNPTEGFTEMQTLFVNEVKNYPDEILDTLANTATALIESPQFTEYIESGLSQI